MKEELARLNTELNDLRARVGQLEAERAENAPPAARLERVPEL